MRERIRQRYTATAALPPRALHAEVEGEDSHSATCSSARTERRDWRDAKEGFQELIRVCRSDAKEGLQEYVFAKGLSFTITVVTGSSGSYTEEDFIAFLDKHLVPWGPGKRWGFLLLDAYAPGLEDNVQRLCWSRGYVAATLAGGATCVAQSNNTHYRSCVRKRFVGSWVRLGF